MHKPDWGDYWAGARQMGLPGFLVKRGSVLGLIMFGLLVVVPRLFKMVDDSGLPVGAFVLFMLMGYGFAGMLWWANERSYNKLARPAHPPAAKRDKKTLNNGPEDD